MKTDKINRLVRDFLHGDMPEEIQRRFRRWMTAPADRETKDAALFQAWTELLARPAESDYRHKLTDIHRRIDLLDRAGKRGRFISLRRFAAAAALLALVVCGEYLFLRSRYERTPSVCLVTAQGSKGEFTLPDGTRVWLNGDSRLSYPETFDAEARRVWLDGEAFFQVRHDASHPFVVDMEVMQVEVLGTEFDARHRTGTRYAETVLRSGSVRVLTPDRKSPIRRPAGLRFPRSPPAIIAVGRPAGWSSPTNRSRPYWSIWNAGTAYISIPKGTSTFRQNSLSISNTNRWRRRCA